jgi:hypothetical protein
MNPTNDALVTITESELASILLSRKRRNLSSRYPVTDEAIGNLTPEGRLWYVVEFMQQSFESKRDGHPAAAEQWRERAFAAAAVVARDAAAHGMADMLRSVADALEARHQPVNPQSTQQRITGWVNEYCRTHGKLPSQKMLKEFATDHGVKLRVEDVSNIFSSVQVRFPVDKRGRKPGN